MRLLHQYSKIGRFRQGAWRKFPVKAHDVVCPDRPLLSRGMKGSLSRAPRRPKPSRRRRFGRGRGEHDGAAQKQSDPCRLSGKAIGLGGSSVHKSGKPPHRTAALFPLSGYPAEKRADSPNAVRPLFSISPSSVRLPPPRSGGGHHPTSAFPLPQSRCDQQPWARMASTTFSKPAMLAPAT